MSTFEWQPVWPPGELPGPLPGSVRRVVIDGETVFMDGREIDLAAAKVQLQRREEEGRGGIAERRLLVVRLGHGSTICDVTPGIGSFAAPGRLEAEIRARTAVEDLPLRRLHPLRRRRVRVAAGALGLAGVVAVLVFQVAERV